MKERDIVEIGVDRIKKHEVAKGTVDGEDIILELEYGVSGWYILLENSSGFTVYREGAFTYETAKSKFDKLVEKYKLERVIR